MRVMRAFKLRSLHPDGEGKKKRRAKEEKKSEMENESIKETLGDIYEILENF